MNNVKQPQTRKEAGQAFLRKRKMMLVLPILVIPFITLAFWALGGGKTKVGESGKDPAGLNLHLPNPKVKEKVLDKLGFYEKTDRDSMKLKEEMQNDPYYQDIETKSTDDLATIARNSADRFHQSVKLNTSPYHESTGKAEEKLMQKLAQLKEINQLQDRKPDEYPQIDKDLPTDSKVSVNRLENRLPSMNEGEDSDPELDKLSGMMDKIIAIQHPEKFKDQQPSSQESPAVCKVTNQSPDDLADTGFFSLDVPGRVTAKSNAIEAVVNEDQELVSGSIIKLRLVDDAYLKDAKIPAGNFVYGVASLDGERLKVKVNSIRVGHSIYPVKMKVYDLDGLEGIYIPGAINRDVAKQSADNSLQTMQLTSMDPSLAAQATAAGISTAKNLLSRKMKLVKVMVKAGYKVLLKN